MRTASWPVKVSKTAVFQSKTTHRWKAGTASGHESSGMARESIENISISAKNVPSEKGE